MTIIGLLNLNSFRTEYISFMKKQSPPFRITEIMRVKRFSDICLYHRSDFSSYYKSYLQSCLKPYKFKEFFREGGFLYWEKESRSIIRLNPNLFYPEVGPFKDQNLSLKKKKSKDSISNISHQTSLTTNPEQNKSDQNKDFLDEVIKTPYR